MNKQTAKDSSEKQSIFRLFARLSREKAMCDSFCLAKVIHDGEDCIRETLIHVCLSTRNVCWERIDASVKFIASLQVI